VDLDEVLARSARDQAAYRYEIFGVLMSEGDGSLPEACFSIAIRASWRKTCAFRWAGITGTAPRRAITCAWETRGTDPRLYQCYRECSLGTCGAADAAEPLRRWCSTFKADIRIISRASSKRF